MMNYLYYNHNYFPGLGILGFIFQIAWWVLIFWLLMAIIRHFNGHDSSHPADMGDTSDTALKILRERYAKGEITKKEFDSMKKDLT